MIKIFWKTIDEKIGYMERIEIPDAESIYFDKDAGKIELAPMTEYIGEECTYFVDNEPIWSQVLDDVGLNEDGIMALHFVLPDNE